MLLTLWNATCSMSLGGPGPELEKGRSSTLAGLRAPGLQAQGQLPLSPPFATRLNRQTIGTGCQPRPLQLFLCAENRSV